MCVRILSRDWRCCKGGDAMTDDELNEWAAMADEATAGPFIVVEGDCHGSESDRWSVCAVRDGKSFFVATVENGAPGDTLETEQANAKLFAASRTAIPALVAEVRRLRALSQPIDMDGPNRGRWVWVDVGPSDTGKGEN